MQKQKNILRFCDFCVDLQECEWYSINNDSHFMREKGGAKLATNMQLLRAKIVERRLTQEKVARSIGIDESTFSRKMKTDGMAFSIGEMHRIAEVLQLSAEDAQNIFLC